MSPSVQGARAEVAVITLAVLALGAVFALVVPPCQAPDEGYSFLRAYHVASGHFTPERVGGWGGGRFPPGVVRIVEAAGPLVGRPDRKITREDWLELASLDNDGEPRAVAYPTAAPYTAVPFLPQAGGIAVARSLGCGPLATFYSGRFANLVFGTAIVGLALALAPVGRRFLGLVALMPMTVHLFGSYAPDVGVIGAGSVLTALVLRLGATEGRRATWCEVAGLALCAAGIAACKPPYLPLALLVLAVPAARFGGEGPRAVVVAGTVVLGLAVAAAGAALTRPYYPDPNDHFGFPVSVRGQTDYAAGHPLEAVEAVTRTIVGQGFAAGHRLYVLGWVDTRLNPAAVVVHALVLLMMGAAARADLGVIPARWPAALAVGGALGLVVLSMYLWCTPVGAPIARGLHGRYLLPLLPALPFLLPARLVPARALPLGGRAIAISAAVLILVAALVAVVTRYYVAGS